MAHLPGLREFKARLHAVRDRLPVDCLLCGTRAHGGLCEYCRHAVCSSMLAGAPRCRRCDLVLPVTTVGNEKEQAAALGGSRIEARPDMAAELDTAACPDCEDLSPGFERVIAAFDYAWPGELLIHRLKLQSRLACAPVITGLLAARYVGILAEAGPRLWDCTHTLVVAVPASRHSIVLRGFNPAAEIGRGLARRLGLAWRPDLLIRAREGRHQKGLNRLSRRASVEGLYSCLDEVAGREILVVDDVMTTGSTLGAIAKVFKDKGALKVWAAVAARTPSRRDGVG